MTSDDLKFGIFLAPYLNCGENPASMLENALQLVQHLEALGYDTVWFAEDHSSGSQIITSPEVFIAAAARRTKYIRFGAGFTSLPFQHPLILANRMMQLHHLTQGRVAFGLGLSALPAESLMKGFGLPDQRKRMLEAVDVLVPLLRGKTVTKKTSWFDLGEVRLQPAPYTNTAIEMAMASQISPAGAQTAGAYGLGLLSIGATSAGGFDTLAANWEIVERAAKKNGQKVDRKNWSLVGPVHIAESREQAIEDVKFGLCDWLAYFRDVAELSIAPPDVQDPALSLVESGLAVIGTPDDAIAQIKRLQAQSGGFGHFLQMAHNWADRDQTKKSIELFARYVTPEFRSNRDANREHRGRSSKKVD